MTTLTLIILTPRTLTVLNLTLANPHDALESFCVRVFCDFIQNYTLSFFNGIRFFLQHFNNFSILMVGRLLGGIATSILYSAFESWLIHEHHKVFGSTAFHI